jgi:galactokinase
MDTPMIVKAFKHNFDAAPTVVVRSPGRINLIGEHTDYNDGFVLPAAIDKAIYMAFNRSEDHKIHLHSLDMNESYSFAMHSLEKSGFGWADYIIGVLLQLQKKGIGLQGFNCVFGGDIPIGAGLSSSAALECGTAYGLSTLFDYPLDRKTIALIGQAAENEFVGVKCGIMDQFANMHGQQGKVIRLDCASLDFAYFPFDTADIDIVLLDTHVKHSLAGSEYNKRREECEAGVAAMQLRNSSIRSLRYASLNDLESVKSELAPDSYNRCRYVIEEIERIQVACTMLQQNDLAGFGQKMYATHEGLQHLYEVSCPELDFLVNQARKNGEVLGARMMGGGFGGCTINLVHKAATQAFIEKAAAAYETAFGRKAGSYVVAIANGTSLAV